MSADEYYENGNDEDQNDVFDEIQDESENGNDDSESEEDEDFISEEEDEALQRKYRIDKGYKGFQPTLTEDEKQKVMRGEASYEEIKNWQWDTQAHAYWQEKARTASKRQFKTDLDEVFDGIENISELTHDYYNIVKDGSDDDFRNQRKDIHEKIKQAGKDKAKDIADELLENRTIDEKGYSYIIDEFIR
jgi:hypothetical protein